VVGVVDPLSTSEAPQLSLPLNAHALVDEGNFSEANHHIQSSSRCVGDGVGKVVFLTSSSP
jgi:hypothetical protein